MRVVRLQGREPKNRTLTPAFSNANPPAGSFECGRIVCPGGGDLAYTRAPSGATFSAQPMRPLTCIATKSVMIAPIMIARPVKPSKKKA